MNLRLTIICRVGFRKYCMGEFILFHIIGTIKTVDSALRSGQAGGRHKIAVFERVFTLRKGKKLSKKSTVLYAARYEVVKTVIAVSGLAGPVSAT